MLSLKFEVFGKVQGVSFRYYTKKKAISLNLVGWCKNTSHNTVLGIAQGYETGIQEFKSWLENEGSPSSKIEKTTFQEDVIEKPDYDAFTILK